jgi:hypothetical protein
LLTLRLASLLSAAAALVLLGGCGSSSPATGGQAGASAKRAAGLAFAGCMRSHGVPNFPDLPSGPGGRLQIAASQRSGSGTSMTVNGVPVSAPAFKSAQKVCQKYLPRPRPLTAEQLANIRRAAVAMAVCMRSHGVRNFPDPTVRTGPFGGIGLQLGPRGGSVDPGSPVFQAARKACGPILKGALPGPS